MVDMKVTTTLKPHGWPADITVRKTYNLQHCQMHNRQHCYLITFKIDWLDFWFKLVRDSDRDCVSYLDSALDLCIRTVVRQDGFDA